MKDGLTIKYVIFTPINDGVQKPWSECLYYVDDPEWDDMSDYNFPTDVRKAKMYDTAEEAIDVVRGLMVYPFYVRAICLGFANDGIV